MLVTKIKRLIFFFFSFFFCVHLSVISCATESLLILLVHWGKTCLPLTTKYSFSLFPCTVTQSQNFFFFLICIIFFFFFIPSFSKATGSWFDYQKIDFFFLFVHFHSCVICCPLFAISPDNPSLSWHRGKRQSSAARETRERDWAVCIWRVLCLIGSVSLLLSDWSL